MPTGQKHVVIQFITWNETSGSMRACVRSLGAHAKMLLLWFPRHVPNSVKENKVCFILAPHSAGQKKQGSAWHNSQLKKRLEFQAYFWRDGGGVLLFFLWVLAFLFQLYRELHYKEQAKILTPTARRSKVFCFCHLNKGTFKTKIRTENSGVHPQSWGRGLRQKHTGIT